MAGPLIARRWRTVHERNYQLGHVALKVKDVDKSLDFYVNKLGFPEMLRLHRDDGRLWLVYLRITDDQYLELFPEAVGDRAPAETPTASTISASPSTTSTPSSRSSRQGGVSLFRPLKEGADYNRQAWVEDPDGNRIELMEMSPRALQFAAIERLRKAG